VFNKQGKYDVIRKIVEDTNFASDIAYFSGNTDQNIDPKVVCAIFAAFSSQCHSYHPILHTVVETNKKFISDFHHPGDSAVPWVSKHQDSLLKNKDYFQTALLCTGLMDEAVTMFAYKYPNTRLDVSRVKRFPIIKMDEENWTSMRRVSPSKVFCLLAGISQLTTYNEETDEYGFVPYFKEFLSHKNIMEYIKKFVASSEVFPDKNYKKDILAYPGGDFRVNPKYFREACRIMRDEYQAFKVQKEVELAKTK
jgi:hypothetical protein